MKVHDDQSVIEKTGSTPLKYSPTVLVSTLLESWPIPPLTCVSRWIKTENEAAAVKRMLPLQT